MSGWFTKPHLLVLAMSALVATGGCGNLTAGGFGEVAAEVVGDGGDEADALSTLALPAFSIAGKGGPGAKGGPGGQGGGAFQGEVTVELRVLIRSDAGVWTELTDGIQRVEVDASGTTVAEIARSSLPGGEYDRVRVEFSRAEVFVTSAPPGLGIPGDGHVVVDFGGAPTVQVERPLGFRLNESGARLRVDLRAGAWIRAAVLGSVPAATFRSSVQIRVVGSDGES